MDTRKLPAVRELKLAEQQDGLLSELPDEVGLLRVTKLELQGNALKMLPDSFYAMNSLETLNLCETLIVDGNHADALWLLWQSEQPAGRPWKSH